MEGVCLELLARKVAKGLAQEARGILFFCLEQKGHPVAITIHMLAFCMIPIIGTAILACN